MKARLKALRDHAYRSITLQYLERRQSINPTLYPQLVCLSSDFITSYLCVDGRYELEEIEFILRNFRDKIENRTVLDVGANIGNHTVAFAGLARKVMAFEPNPQLYKILCLNVGDHENVRALNVGASDVAGEFSALIPAGNAGGGGIERKGSGRRELFTVRPLDELGPIPDLGLVKVDVEGHEDKALRGMRKLLAAPDVLVIFEQNSDVVRDGTTPSVQLLREMGFNHLYELDVQCGWRSASRIGRLLERLVKAVPQRTARLSQVERLANRSYPCLVASKEAVCVADGQ